MIIVKNAKMDEFVIGTRKVQGVEIETRIEGNDVVIERITPPLTFRVIKKCSYEEKFVSEYVRGTTVETVVRNLSVGEIHSEREETRLLWVDGYLEEI